MGRKSSRDLWTAKLTGKLAANARDGVRESLAAGGQKSIGTPSTGAPLAGTPSTGAPLAGTPSTGTPSTGGRQKSTNKSLAAAIGSRPPFHGVVLGIDPSLRGTGIAIVRFSPPEQPRLLFSATVRNKPSLSSAQCLGNIARAVTQALETYRPVCVALEQTVYVQNVKTSLILGSARGAAIAPAAMQGLEVFEYAPSRLKQAVVGHGRASKEQVAAMVRSLVQAGRDLLPSDEADAAAAAICHAFTVRL